MLTNQCGNPCSSAHTDQAPRGEGFAAWVPIYAGPSTAVSSNCVANTTPSAFTTADLTLVGGSAYFGRCTQLCTPRSSRDDEVGPDGGIYARWSAATICAGEGDHASHACSTAIRWVVISGRLLAAGGPGRLSPDLGPGPASMTRARPLGPAAGPAHLEVDGGTGCAETTSPHGGLSGLPAVRARGRPFWTRLVGSPSRWGSTEVRNRGGWGCRFARRVSIEFSRERFAAGGQARGAGDAARNINRPDGWRVNTTSHGSHGLAAGTW